MKPILYDVGESAFTTDGLGTLTDCISCQVTEERNGVYELQMEYPKTGIHFDQLKNGRYIKTATAPDTEPQLFRIYGITRPLNGRVTVNAEHISYELSGNPVTGFTASGTASAMLQQLFQAGAFDNPFTVSTDFTGTSSISFPGPSSIRGILGGVEGSFLDKFHGEYEFDNFHVTLWSNRGADNGVTIEYGKNLTDITQDESIESTYTSIVPYVRQQQDGQEAYVYLPEKYLDAPNAGYFARRKALAVDFSSSFDQQEAVDVNVLRQLGEQYIENNDIGVPTVSLEVSFVDLRQTIQYKDVAPLETVHLCDLVTVKFPDLEVETKAKVVKTVYDSLLERYVSIDIGTVQVNFVREYAGWQQSTNNGLGNVQTQILTQTQLITGNKGGNVVIGLSPFGVPQEYLMMDTTDKATAKNVWRWNMGGLGFSSNGYNGPFDKIALTMDGQINANMITTGHMLADIIQGGTLTDLTGALELNLNDGNIELVGENNTTRISTLGFRIFDENDDAVVWINPVGVAVYGYDSSGATSSMSTLTSIEVAAPSVAAESSFLFQDKTASWTYDSSLGKYVLTAEE